MAIFDPSQLKSADPVTYDNNGNVIPLSERFNEKQADIRYSLSDFVTYSTNEQIGKQIKEQGLTATLETLADRTPALVSRDDLGNLFVETAAYTYNGFNEEQAKALLSFEIDGIKLHSRCPASWFDNK